MNIEQNRLNSFRNWPAFSVIEPARIAKGGFYATGCGFEVECFACGKRIDNWNYGDQVIVRHRILNPQCPFVLNPTNSGNVALTPNTSELASRLVPVEMSDEQCRLASFSTWPCSNIIPPKLLAEAGFFYLNKSDKVKCFKCNFIVGKWVAGDKPIEEHKRLSPNCEFIRQYFVPGDKISITSNEQVISQTNLQELGIQKHKGPHQPKFATLESRLRSFDGWPDELVQTPEALAEAGFYYTGSNDQVRCFHCDGGLRRWDPQDEPWREHARCFPTCGFLLLVKGQMFVQNLAEVNSNLDGSVEGATRSFGTEPFDRIRVLSDQDLQNLMDSSEARTALGIGLHVGRIKQAIKYKVEHTGTPFSTADALIEAALNVQLEELDSTDEHDNQISNAVSRLLTQAISQANVESNLPTNSVQKTDIVTNKIDESMTNIPPAKIMTLEEENRRLKEARLCKICLDTEVGVVFLPCGHLATCINCAPSLKDCPVCRSSIKAFIRTFLS